MPAQFEVFFYFIIIVLFWFLFLWREAERVWASSWMFKQNSYHSSRTGLITGRAPQRLNTWFEVNFRDAAALQQIHLMCRDWNTEQTMAERLRLLFSLAFTFLWSKSKTQLWSCKNVSCFSFLLLRLLLIYLWFWYFIDSFSAVFGFKNSLTAYYLLTAATLIFNEAKERIQHPISNVLKVKTHHCEEIQREFKFLYERTSSLYFCDNLRKLERKSQHLHPSQKSVGLKLILEKNTFSHQPWWL